jgi:uncharacterized protein YjbI with pentapeptide repeats
MTRTLEDETIEGLDLAGQDEPNLRLLDLELSAPDLANLRAHGGAIMRSTIVAGRLTGASWYGGSVGDVVVRDCRADLAGFALTRLSRVLFERCDLRESDFAGARLTDVAFRDCDLTRADFAESRFDRCHMVRCTLDGVRLGSDLAGLTMPWDDVVGAAAVLAAALGLAIEDRDGG